MYLYMLATNIPGGRSKGCAEASEKLSISSMTPVIKVTVPRHVPSSQVTIIIVRRLIERRLIVTILIFTRLIVSKFLDSKLLELTFLDLRFLDS